ncbi:MAG: signal peptidase I [Nanoarchaeota archaeon]|nr:signal peptidase I [Nanoarchaeota archaeon]|tara:strand:- start:5220 stop:5900 length:681 start_codon:yes stop_codon:yes gene_type:complete
MNWKKIWYFIWREDSWSSWVVNVVLAIIIVKFLIYPGLGLLLGTGFPVVAVVSCSMQHEESNCWPDFYMKSGGSFEDLKRSIAKPKMLCGKAMEESNQNSDYWEVCGGWYESREITKEEFSKFPQNKGFNIGDIFILQKPKDIKLGEVIVYNNGFNAAPIIHRVIEINEEDGKTFYKTKGDYNEKSYAFEEKISENKVYGKVLLKVPYLGWVKIMFNMLLKMVGVV